MSNEIAFLIQCFFGDTEDPYLASIDRAYFDMQTHTISGNKIDIYEMRRRETECLYEQIMELPEEADFDDWHEKTSRKMKKMDTPVQLTYGQIQKWINMTIKYLYTLRSLGVASVDKYFVEHKDDFHAPIDSYVLKHLNMEDTTWSRIQTYEDYLRIREKITFDDEYLDWPQYANSAQKKQDGTDRLADKGSYKRYIQEYFSNNGKNYCGKTRWESNKYGNINSIDIHLYKNDEQNVVN